MLGWFKRLFSWWKRELPTAAAAAPATALARLDTIVLTDGVARTLFEDYAEHRRSARGDEEIGWLLMGLRHGSQAIALAAIPAGAERDAGAAHVQFNSEAQALASRILRQSDRRLRILGVVHTHPGRLRVPSDGDLHGDRQWVGQLQGGEGVFAIGTADAHADHHMPAANVQAKGELCFSWYVLGADDERYRKLDVQVTMGSDLAGALRPAWDVIETQAAPLNRLCRLFLRVQLDIAHPERETALLVKIDLAEPHQQLHLLLNSTSARYYWSMPGEMIAIDPEEPQIDRAVHLILADLAREATGTLSQVVVES